jgi:hypothetical protein
MKIIPGKSIRGQVRNEYLMHTFDKDIHCDFGSMGSGNPHRHEAHSGEDEKGTVWYFLISKSIVQEVVEVFRSATPKSYSMRKQEC